MRKSKRKQKLGYQGGLKPTHKVYYIEMKRKSNNGVEYTYYKKVVDIIKEETKDEPKPKRKNTKPKPKS